MLSVEIKVNGKLIETIDILNTGIVRDLSPEHSELADTVCLYEWRSSRVPGHVGVVIHERADGFRDLVRQVFDEVYLEDPEPGLGGQNTDSGGVTATLSE